LACGESYNSMTLSRTGVLFDIVPTMAMYVTIQSCTSGRKLQFTPAGISFAEPRETDEQLWKLNRVQKDGASCYLISPKGNDSYAVNFGELPEGNDGRVVGVSKISESATPLSSQLCVIEEKEVAKEKVVTLNASSKSTPSKIGPVACNKTTRFLLKHSKNARTTSFCAKVKLTSNGKLPKKGFWRLIFNTGNAYSLGEVNLDSEMTLKYTDFSGALAKSQGAVYLELVVPAGSSYRIHEIRYIFDAELN